VETNRIVDPRIGDGGIVSQLRNAGQSVPGTLASRMDSTPLPPRDVIDLLLAVCELLREIHRQGLAHASITPGNLRFTESGQISLDSFDPPPADATFLMRDPKYASPELLLAQTSIEGTAHDVSDIYVLGFVAYEALAGQESLQRELLSTQGNPENELFWMKWHADAERTLPSLYGLNPSIPKELSSIIEKMIEKDPGKRFRDFDELEAAIVTLRPRLMTTESIEAAVFLQRDPLTVPNDLKPAKTSQRILLAIPLLGLAVGTGWWLLKDGDARAKVSELASWTERNAVSAKVRLTGEKTQVAERSSFELPATIQTANGPMVLVKSGAFEMGSGATPNEGPARTVYLGSFYIDKFEVSNARYRAFTDATGYIQPATPTWDPDYFAKGSLPVLNVSWRDAQAFCVAAKKRLPSEAEWEKAARGAEPGSRFWANWTVAGLANLKRGGSSSPSPIGSFPADVSPFGVFDMAGNVHEWVNDQYGLYSGNRISLDEASTAKVVRGGSFALSPDGLSPSWRASHEATIEDGEDSPIGFRCAADIRVGTETQHSITSR
jgi:formylglycine-generating enzyme